MNFISVRLFRPNENAERLEESCARICMPLISRDVFIDACKAVIKENIEYVPPYGSGGSLYLRPLLFGSGPVIGLRPADEYTFIIMAVPMGSIYGVEAVKALVIENHDRSAPRGMGDVKVAGNYAADLRPHMMAKASGYPLALYLDAKTNTFIEEFSSSNFIAIDKAGTYLTPRSTTILPSITNKTLVELARDEGIPVEIRAISVSEIDSFTEVAACGTAVVMTPVGSITYQTQAVETNSGHVGFGPVFDRLYKRFRAIQLGEVEDKFGWMVNVPFDQEEEEEEVGKGEA